MANFKVFYRNAGPSRSFAPDVVPSEWFGLVTEVDAADLEEVFRVMNTVDGSDSEVSTKLGVRSMSVGDVAVDEAGRAWYCQGAGWGETKMMTLDEIFPDY